MMEDAEIKERVLKALEPMFKEAEENGLWFHSQYQDLWFSPASLAKAQAEGRFIWGAVNWDLRDPKEKLAALRREAEASKKAVEEFEKRIAL